MTNKLLTLLLVLPFFLPLSFVWAQCAGTCPSNDALCDSDPNCCIADGDGTTSVDDCLGNAGISIVRVKYDATVSSGIDARNTRFCLVSNSNLVLANNVIVDNTTCFDANGNNDVIVTIGGTTFTFNAGPQLNLLNAALASLPTGVTIQDVVNLLPVQLSSYTVKSSAQGMLLEWTTATESNNNYFELERSHDGHFFEKIAHIPAKGDGSQAQQYQHFDQGAKSGLNYYRLSQYDFDGTKANLGLVQASKVGSSTTITPNPVVRGGRISLNTSVNALNLPAATFQLTNTLGQSWPLNYDQEALTLPASLSKGLYYLMIIQPSGHEVLPLVITD